MALSGTTRLVLISTLIVGIICSNSKRVIERIKYLENRINTESQFRNEEYIDVIDRLDAIDKQLNVFTERRVGFVNSDLQSSDVNTENVDQLRDDFTRFQKAFREEKSETARVRRELPRIENDLTAVKQDLEYYCTKNLNKTDELISRVEESDDLLKTDMVQTNNKINELKSTLVNSINNNSVLVVQELKVTAEQMEERMQRTAKELQIMENTTRQEITAVKHDLEYYSTKNLNKTEELLSRFEELNDAFRTDMKFALQSTRQEFKVSVAEMIEASVKRTVKELQVMENSKRQEITQTKAKVESIEMLVSKLSDRLEYLFEYDSCSEYKSAGMLRSGVYKLRQGPEVYCDQATDGGGWLVFQRRQSGEVDFYRNWAEYKHGFGDLNGEFWLGNEHLSSLTAVGSHELRIDMEDFDGNKAYAKYSKFKIYSEEERYKLEIRRASGNAGDSLGYHNGMAFTTFDNDNDKWSSVNCAKDRHGAWWYNSCAYSNLNGQYYNEPGKRDKTGIRWHHWKRNNYNLKYVEMKFR